ncbi:molybdopterin converting factor subunit 1 [Marinobacter sp. SS21]|uniref:molybdopterin converting factor subunit 1 n=1 Tax=Marinobacter sp. SS21 TaxID=2979460 RepID=UPI00232E478C|nr:molybdopterin converting factor subunit 1 [Marinobacter sp. SS21]MDC0661316.1 molybdopterin converting factor subunit 1 [Marinobacter sp. SS21]
MTNHASTVTVKYFARLREHLGIDTEQLAIAEQSRVSDVLATLSRRGGPWQELDSDRPLLVAVNQAMAKTSTTLADGDEVAFFPPVTGG